ncbi:hypothetical protein PYK22_01205 [Pyrinomonas methylaliphatogenes]|uniref:Uncharacterized protein n=1 Tax=Pyrinomonas methylaliphatogenes TaxID=454194 RepID=A0A0B6WWT3_9BACT|nr:hypothetical protein PYK22_01205 [Pyrinomonas methylaliphatogenes]
MTDDEVARVIQAVKELCARYARPTGHAVEQASWQAV